MARRRRHEEHENHEAWAIPYGDLVTLLLAFFVVMYSMSEVNDGKYRVLSNSLTEAFGGTPHANSGTAFSTTLKPIQVVLPDEQVSGLIAAGLPDQHLLAGAARAQQAAQPAPAAAAAQPAATPNPPATAADMQEQRELAQVTDDVSSALQSLIASGQVRVRRYGSWIAVDISTDILFDSGAARLSPPAIQALQRLAAALAPWPNSVRVEGHTDDRPIRTAAFPSNWELSAARAASVVHLFMDHGVAPQRLAVLGFGQYRPTMPNTTAAGRNANRRVSVVILGREAAPEAGL
ncbi:MAG TPA: flagellar motor protein MotD [Steroidobacteraceae bacterium]|jgi:chemotaxis protein MotB|nr:flagellar motor protein MotD [Steroidobacteraceae bacterium]